MVIASGARPAKLGIPGEEHLITSEEFLELDELPKRIVFVGGGYISMEFANVAVRAQVRPADGRLLRAEALAEVLVSDLKTSDLATERATYKRVDGLRRCYEEEEEYAPTRALTRAVTDVKGEHLNGQALPKPPVPVFPGAKAPPIGDGAHVLTPSSPAVTATALTFHADVEDSERLGCRSGCHHSHSSRLVGTTASYPACHAAPMRCATSSRS